MSRSGLPGFGTTGTLRIRNPTGCVNGSAGRGEWGPDRGDGSTGRRRRGAYPPRRPGQLTSAFAMLPGMSFSHCFRTERL